MRSLLYLEYTGFGHLMVDLIVLLTIAAALAWLMTIIYCLVLRRRKQKKVIGYTELIQLGLQRAIISLMVIFTLYFVVFLAVNGTYSFNWSAFPLNKSNTYYCIFPQLITFLIILGTYLFSDYFFKRKIKSK